MASEYKASKSSKTTEAIETRIVWLKNNLGAKETKEDKQMALGYRALYFNTTSNNTAVGYFSLFRVTTASKSSKTTSFNLN
jgi:hypothetical protein